MATSTEPMDQKQNSRVWIFQWILCIAFLIAGTMKLVMTKEALTELLTWPGLLPVEFVRIIGVAEIAGALGCVLPMLTGIRPILTSYAAFGLLVLMIGAIGFDLMLIQSLMILVSITLGAMAVYVGLRRMP